ncbi:MAG: DNA topoisomerase 4 subunit A, partial [Clostridia bacterium]|nr:DNA topoisomerase 4 subunit A [Clostridia bacterium]
MPKIIQHELQDILHESMMTYAEYVLLDRALPRVEDGLKPVQRRILYTMYELGLQPDKPHRKCARIVGDAMGKYHPHGDSSVYDALVRMGQWFNMGVPHVHPQGNFGNIDGDAPAAMRYTEARLTPAAMEMLRGIEQDTVDYTLNFDDTLKEPTVLPCRFPNLLVNGATGIAVGLATSIPPHHPVEAIDAVLALINDPSISLSKLMKKLPGPDFPTGGVMIPGEGLRQAYETGRGRITLRAKCEIEKGQNGRNIIAVTELPFQIKKTALLEKMTKVMTDKKDLGIWEVRDESDREGLRVVAEVRKDYDPQQALAALYRWGDLQIGYNFNMVVIQQGKPVQMGLIGLLQAYIAHQRDVITRRTRYELNEAQQRAHILEGYIIAVDNIDRVIKIIRGSSNTREAREKLMEAFALTQIQAQAILDMPLRRLTALEIEDLKKEYAALLEKIARLEAILKDDSLLMAVIVEELKEVRKTFTFQRRTAIDDIDVKAEQAYAEPPPQQAVPCAVTLSETGHIKRVSVKETVTGTVIYTQTDHKLLGLTNHGNLCWVPVSSLPEGKPRDKGTLFANFIGGFDEGEELVTLACPDLWPQGCDVLFYTAKGLVKRTSAIELQSRKSKIAGVTLKNGDAAIGMEPCLPDTDIMMVSSVGQAIRFPSGEIPPQG